MKALFLTGGTGMLGSCVGYHYLTSSRRPLVLLVRSQSSAPSRSRALAALSFWGDIDDSLVQVVNGDLLTRHFGLTQGEFAGLASQVDRIVHCAADLRLDQEPQNGIDESLRGVENILELASLAGAVKIEHVSTVGVGGRGIHRLPERFFLPSQGRQFRNGYEAAKAAAEDRMRQAFNEGFPVTVHRPSMIVGDSATGQTPRAQVFGYLCKFLSGKKSAGFIPTVQANCIDTIPCDFVAKAILISLDKPLWTGRILQESSGEQSILVATLADRIAVVSGIRPRKIPQDLFLALAGLWLRGLGRGRNVGVMQFILPYLKEPQLFENGITSALLREEGLPLPDPSSYLEKALQQHCVHVQRPKDERPPRA